MTMKVLTTRPLTADALKLLSAQVEVDSYEEDSPMPPDELVRRVASAVASSMFQ